jgi:hypothetical protein
VNLAPYGLLDCVIDVGSSRATPYQVLAPPRRRSVRDQDQGCDPFVQVVEIPLLNLVQRARAQRACMYLSVLIGIGTGRDGVRRTNSELRRWFGRSSLEVRANIRLASAPRPGHALAGGVAVRLEVFA